MFLSPISLAVNRPGRRSVNLEQAVAALFANNEQGAWYDPSDYSLMMQDRIGTTVTNVEQPVGIIFDRRLGATLGAELVDTMNSSTAAWTSEGNTISVSIDNEITITYAVSQASWAVLSAAAGLSSNLTVGKWYTLTAEAKVNSGSSVQVFVTTDARIDGPSITSTSYVPVRFDFLATNATTTIWGARQMVSGETITFRNISVKLRDGNHAYQTGSTARPVLRARYNLLTYSEQFDNAYWTKSSATIAANSVVAPDGTTTADTITFSSSGGRIQRAINVSGQCVSIYVKPNVGTRFAIDTAGVVTGDTTIFELSGVGSVVSTGANNSNSTITALANGWYRISTARGSTAGGTIYIGALGAGGGSTDSFYIWGADLRVGTSAGDYQRIAAATDYATVSTITGQPFRPYLDFDGADFLETATFDTPTTSVATVWTGVTARTTGIFRFITEYGPNGATTNNSFGMSNGSAASGPLYVFLKGTAASAAEVTSAGYTPPWLKIITGQYDTTAASAALATTLRTNGALDEASTTGSAPAGGNWSAQKLYIGLRTATSLYWNGVMYGYILRMAATDDAQVTTGETYMAGKTGVTL